MFPHQKPYRPTVQDLHNNGRHFPPNYLHESWVDYLYWEYRTAAVGDSLARRFGQLLRRRQRAIGSPCAPPRDREQHQRDDHVVAGERDTRELAGISSQRTTRIDLILSSSPRPYAGRWAGDPEPRRSAAAKNPQLHARVIAPSRAFHNMPSAITASTATTTLRDAPKDEPTAPSSARGIANDRRSVVRRAGDGGGPGCTAGRTTLRRSPRAQQQHQTWRQ